MKKKKIVVDLRKEREKITLDYFLIRQALLILRSVNNYFRQNIILILGEYKNLCVTDIYTKLRFEQSVASHHLSILKSSGVVEGERHGRFIYYSLNYERIKQIFKFSKEITA